MKINILTIVLFTFSFLNCQEKQMKSFEGVIKYNITFVSKTDDKEYIKYQKQKFGDKIDLYVYENGSFVKEYSNTGNKGYQFVLYNPKNQEVCAKWKNLDEVYCTSSLISSTSLLNEKELPSEQILNESCKGYSISMVEPKSGQQISLSYFYPENDLYINPELYSNFKDGFYNIAMQKMKAPYYKFIMDMGKYEIIYEVEKVEKMRLDKTKIEAIKSSISK
ncbi:hypothetical protein DRF65_01965 [Chryseobacterium pennae]|uniref:Lipoprotein n=1 Tax=Chryseobacterium pennae TaxID=2258962 RepID=A0A3D9CFJ2_9FLAO|nr:hypothetical protein [Chryseobacterium pennae]REC64362.1 hypothetical protein DRF65_01965 [Chryseobacterium pennae]